MNELSHDQTSTIASFGTVYDRNVTHLLIVQTLKEVSVVDVATVTLVTDSLVLVGDIRLHFILSNAGCSGIIPKRFVSEYVNR